MRSLSISALLGLCLTALPRAAVGRHIVDDDNNNYYDDRRADNYYYDDGRNNNNDDQWFAEEKAKKLTQKVSVSSLQARFRAYKAPAPKGSGQGQGKGSLRMSDPSESSSPSGFLVMNENACMASSKVTSAQVSSFTAPSPSAEEPSISIVYKVNSCISLGSEGIIYTYEAASSTIGLQVYSDSGCAQEVNGEYFNFPLNTCLEGNFLSYSESAPSSYPENTILVSEYASNYGCATDSSSAMQYTLVEVYRSTPPDYLCQSGLSCVDADGQYMASYCFLDGWNAETEDLTTAKHAARDAKRKARRHANHKRRDAKRKARKHPTVAPSSSITGPTFEPSAEITGPTFEPSAEITGPTFEPSAEPTHFNFFNNSALNSFEDALYSVIPAEGSGGAYFVAFGLLAVVLLVVFSMKIAEERRKLKQAADNVASSYNYVAVKELSEDDISSSSSARAYAQGYQTVNFSL